MDASHIHSQEEQVPRSTQTRKRQIDSDDDDHEPQPKRARLTRKNLARLDTMARRKKPSNPTDDSGSVKTLSTTTSGFELQAFKNGILDPSNSKPPTNLKDLRERHTRLRETVSPPESTYKRYVSSVERAPNEATIVYEMSRHMLKEYDDDEDYKKTFDQAFTGFPNNVGFNDGLSAPQPDFVEGPQMQTYRPFPVDEHVSGAVLYKDNPYSLTLPHIAGEWKGPDGSMKEAKLQSRYDGAALTYGRDQALTYMGKADPPGHAEVTTFTTDGTQLNLSSHHAAETDDGTLQYHQYPTTSISLTGSFEGFKEGRKHLRNAQDDARKTSYKLRDDLQSHWQATKYPPAPLPTITDDEAAYEIVEPPPSTYEYGADHEATADYPPAPTTLKPLKNDKTSSSHSYYTRSSKVPQPTHDHTSSSSHKKTSSSYTSSHKSSGHSSKHKNYWKKDSRTGGYYHKHSDGTVSWRDDEEW